MGNWVPVNIQSHGGSVARGAQQIPPGGTLCLFGATLAGDSLTIDVQGPYGFQGALVSLYDSATEALAWKRGAAVEMPYGGMVFATLDASARALGAQGFLSIDWHEGPPAEWEVPVNIIAGQAVQLPGWAYDARVVFDGNVATALQLVQPFDITAGGLPGGVVPIQPGATSVAAANGSIGLLVRCRR